MAESRADKPASLINKLAKPTPAYHRHAWLAMAGLAAFVLLYFALAGWFAFTAWRLTFGADAGGKEMFWGVIVGLCAAFLAIFMLKAVFFVKHGGADDTLEITPAQQPQLFEFLHRLADKAGAPRPHKVFVSARVNAAVFYDLSLLNLFFPSRKNLEIGLALVNSLTLGEFRAVLAHEFGHFAQRAMAVGRWVYVAQQIAAHLVARRDKLDDFLRGLSRFDVRIAWVGWILSLIVWSIRSLVDSAFQLVVLSQRALSREMELQADLVAVSLTGSDALIHALHRLQSADDAWSRAVGFVVNEKASGRVTRDVFAVQTQVLSRMGEILNDPAYGRVPPVPDEQPGAHRLFRAELAQPPQMWLTHPLNHVREANAKRHYVSAPIDQRSAWDLFTDAAPLRVAMTAKLLDAADTPPVADEASREALDRQFGREYLASRYRGVYLGRSVVRSAMHADDLVGALPDDPLVAAASLYPATLADDIDRLRSLEREVGQLRAIDSGALNPPDGVLRHRGRQIKRSELTAAIAEVAAELADVEKRLIDHDKQCRGVHIAAARRLGGSREATLRSLLAVLHYADHSEANLRDAQGALANAYRIETATRRVSERGVARLISAANDLQRVMHKVFAERDQVVLDAKLLAKLEAPSWAQAMGELKLPPASRENVAEWLKVVDGWVNHAAGAFSALRTNALEMLLVEEARALKDLREPPTEAEVPAPVANRLPSNYDTLLPGAERKLQTQLDWWARIQTADGMLPGLARLAVAGGIVGVVLGFGGSVGNATVTVHNGLGTPVVVELGGKRMEIAPEGNEGTQLDVNQVYKVRTTTPKGELIETFDADIRGSYGNYVYNVAGASVLVEWTASYGPAAKRPDRLKGAVRWTTTAAEYIFSDPPQSISTRHGEGGTREAMSTLDQLGPAQQLGALEREAERKPMLLAHARWDASTSPHGQTWLEFTSGLPEFPALLAQRLKASPNDLLLMRMEQATAEGARHDEVCARHRAAAAAAPDNPDLAYLGIRCIADEEEKNKAFLDGHARWPQHGWFAYAAGHSLAEQSRWDEALAAMQQARQKVPALADAVGVDIARIMRFTGGISASVYTDLSRTSPTLGRLVSLEQGREQNDPYPKAFFDLARGQLQPALQEMSRVHDSDAKEAAHRQARFLRLVAASDGASPDMVSQALALNPQEGNDAVTVWAALGLAEREQRDIAPHVQALRNQYGDSAKPVLRIIDDMHAGLRGRDLAGLEKRMNGLPLELRGHAYAMGVVALGAQAPQSWRDNAKRLLFASERPYFS
jgi:Zn-dependent protease with chaperone function